MKLDEVQELINKVKVSFIASIDEDGFPNMKAMLAPRKINGIKEFLFSTNTASLRVSQFENNNKASIYFYEKGRFNYQGVLLVGTMEVLQDQDSKDLIWQTGDTMYYKKGKTDPDYCVLKFTAKSGRYYSDFKSENFSV
ncbi:MAG: pyridoxamine 5'-phosphate oxidase family protein [Elusimicrobiota bacterium]|jgi:general stress protein 26|nr:pyridoxamine 5'-phosphate oxidase family protein [Elusimicrobiota bacterium]